MRKLVTGLTTITMALALNSLLSGLALAWGDEGHKIIALIAQSQFDPAAQKKVRALLAADTDDPDHARHLRCLDVAGQAGQPG